MSSLSSIAAGLNPFDSRATGWNGRQFTSASLLAVETQVEVITTQTSSKLLGSEIDSSKRAPSSSALDRLERINPKIAKILREFLRFLGQANSGAADGVAQTMQRVSARVSFAQTSAQNAQRLEQARISVDATITELRARIDNGEEISAEEINISIDIALERSFGFSDPLVLDLDRDGIETTSAQGGHSFDIAATGKRVQVATATGGDGLLALDRNGNGKIDDGSELFGDQHGAADGFAELAKYDGNGDNRIDALDPIFRELQVFRDWNLDGQSSADELSRLSDLRIAAISLDAERTDVNTRGNRISSTSDLVFEDGTKSRVGDVWFRYIS